MDDRAIGLAIRTLRRRRGWRQEDLARRVGTSRRQIGRLESGRVERLSLGSIRATLDALDATLAMRVRWRGEELDRLVNAAHAAMHEAFGRRVSRLAGWTAAAEVSFSIYGERGVIDVLLWHGASRALVVVELKTSIVEIQEMLGTLDRKRRLAPRIARERGWEPATVSAWLVVAEGPTNRRRIAAHGHLLRNAFPLDGRSIGRWLRRPDRPIAALTFLSLPSRVLARAGARTSAGRATRQSPATRSNGRATPLSGSLAGVRHVRVEPAESARGSAMHPGPTPARPAHPRPARRGESGHI